jgi:hypothetical protein
VNRFGAQACEGSRTQELQEFRSQRIWELGEDFPREMLVLDSRIKTLLAYSATPATPGLTPFYSAGGAV